MKSPDKACSICKIVFPRSEFYTSRKGNKGQRSACRKCHNAKQSARYHAVLKFDPEYREKQRIKSRAWEAANPQAQRRRQQADPEKYAAMRRRAMLGITREQFDAMWAMQDGKCPICSEPMLKVGNGSAHADHDHDTGEFRGILCPKCNKGLGLFRDSLHVLSEAWRYLFERPHTQPCECPNCEIRNESEDHRTVIDRGFSRADALGALAPDVDGVPVVVPL